MKSGKKVLTDLVWSVLALGVMHGVLQFVVYPYLNKCVGTDEFGNILYVLAILGIIAPSIGLAASNTRLIQRKEMAVENGDYLLAMFPQIIVGAVVFVVLVVQYLSGPLDLILAIAALILTTLRNYGDVEYRMSLNYKGYFVYYATLSAGYLCGALLFPLTENWIICFLLGEMISTALLWVKGHIYHPLKLGKNGRIVLKAGLVLSGSYLLSNTVIYLDRLLLQNFMDGTAVTVYYVASLLGKTAALLVSSLNGVIIGHLTKNERKVQENQFLKAFGIAIVLGGILYIVLMLICPIFTRLFYPSVADAVMEIAGIANLSQILCFIASPMLTVMLTFTVAKWQLVIQSIYAVTFIVLSILGIHTNGLHGFMICGLIANLLRLTLVFLIGWVQLKNNKQRED